MFQPAQEGEKLALSQQVNEVFGPFDTGDEAERWSARMELALPGREWLIIPLSKPKVVRDLDIDSN
jgi:hypothetical protein